MNDEFIENGFEFEARIKDHIAYFPLAGESENLRFRAPNSYVIIFFERASGIHTIDFVEYEEKDNQIHISFPGQMHSWKTHKGARGHKLILSKRFVEAKLYSSKVLSPLSNKFPVINVPQAMSEKLSFEFKLISDEYKDDNYNLDVLSFRTKIIFSFIDELLGEEERKELLTTRRNPIVVNFFELIEKNFTESKAVAFYADKLSVTPNYLNVITKNTLGVTAKELIDSRVVLEAKRQLKGSTQTIKEVAFNLGFYSIASFSVFIRNRTGIYPSKFRKT
ncbi:AraC family transcriptional regulator [Chryseobacterium sp. G0162]|uniref:AraC family transcriptional regulator n=1 Tax=Chryseobacterium sp. G0162 TaxID=2487063 RepID=UPI000F4F23EB|nr:helix-turn-helix domain-containing protein [Chryseobacterium sp. G0162]AZB07632.1 AraC family transcriptional regulator [Chryseobacterium sp. G0162]